MATPPHAPAHDDLTSSLARTVHALHAVVFDMDGLLLNTEALARKALLLAGEDLSVALDADVCALMIGVPVDGCRQLLIDRYGEDVPHAALFDRSAHHLRRQIEAGDLQLKPGARELLDALRAAGIPRALATSSAREKALHHLAAAGIDAAFDSIVTRDDVARGKPHPDLFVEAARRLSVPPARCLALEDSYNGVRAAHAAGMPVVMVPDLLPPTDEMRTLALAVVPSLTEVVSLVAGRAAAAVRPAA